MAKLYEIISLDTCDLLMPYIFHLIQEGSLNGDRGEAKFPQTTPRKILFCGWLIKDHHQSIYYF